MQGNAKNMRGSASHIKLHAGGGIRFGFMRQNNISGRTLSVTDVCSYIFDADSFTSYQLRDEDTDINMIIAEGDRPQDSYLALSIALREKWFSSLFASSLPREWFRLKPGDRVKVATDAVVTPQGWLVSNYRHVLTTRGRRLEGDYRQRKSPESSTQYHDPFDYVLLVSEDGEHAIEVEKYENGSLKVYATVYRPMSDISETTQFRRPYIVAKNTNENKALDLKAQYTKSALVIPVVEEEEEVTDAQQEKSNNTLTLVTPHITLGMSEATILAETMPSAPEARPPSEATITELVHAALEEAGIPASALQHPAQPEGMPSDEPHPLAANENIASKVEGVIVTPTIPAPNLNSIDQPKVPDHMLACDTQLVTRMIEESGRNKLSLEDIIRKVIDLPAPINDKVYIPFTLSNTEQAALVKRYGLEKADLPAIQQKIVEELQQFAGIK